MCGQHCTREDRERGKRVGGKLTTKPNEQERCVDSRATTTSELRKDGYEREGMKKQETTNTDLYR